MTARPWHTRPMRIALLMHSLNPRGGVVHTIELADALVQLGHDVTVIAAGRLGQALFRPTMARLSVAPLGELPSGLVPMVGARMQAVAAHLRGLNLSEFDVLHSQDSITANALADLQAEGLIGGFLRTVHHLDAFDEPQLTAWQARGVHAARQLLCVSGLWQGVLAREWGRSAHRVGNGVNLVRHAAHTRQAQGEQGLHAAHDDEVLTRIGLPPGTPYWLAVGGVEARKNTARLLHAFALMRKEVPQARLVIVGGASLLEHAQAQAEFDAVRHDHGMAPGQARANHLVLTGPVQDGVLPSLYRRAIALAMPSVKEGFGLVAIEAMACGTPAIVSRIAPFTEHLRPHEAFWVDPLDVRDIAAALRQSWRLEQHLGRDPAQRAEHVSQLRRVASRFDWLASARQHLALYAHGLAGSADPEPGTPAMPAPHSLQALPPPPTASTDHPCHA
ncbi:MSMEG_0565 family glycosyltransferase [Aquabacterium sp. UBA2148]|uniref:MSMEG_0565 family glycosyltransferase n=1 Tax=Aquabacterium sp. UBA2148 TaxID=1946042 RepID=UPI00257FA614|nr:MSMEG_0565 family glycosyltransferase [Aquabacterium sp. UBA2148]